MPHDKKQAPAVLVIDDDEAIRHVLTHMLGRMGFAALEAPDGATGINILRQNPDEIVAILLDLIMSGMSSAEVVAEAKRINENVRVILSSGASDDMVSDVFPNGAPGLFIRKPYRQQDLADLLEDLLPGSD